MGSRVELFAAIGRDSRIEELSIRELARRHGVHRRTIRQALAATRGDRHRAGRRVEAFIAQEHSPGEEAEVDFGEVWVVIGGVRTKCHMFVLWLSHFRKAIHGIYPTQAQESFLAGHVAAFEAIGGVPTRHIKYDNLTSAVAKVAQGPGRARAENDRWVLYGFDPFYCQPGLDGAHEKGGVEGAVGWTQRSSETVDPLDVRGRFVSRHFPGACPEGIVMRRTFRTAV